MCEKSLSFFQIAELLLQSQPLAQEILQMNKCYEVTVIGKIFFFLCHPSKSDQSETYIMHASDSYVVLQMRRVLVCSLLRDINWLNEANFIQLKCKW